MREVRYYHLEAAPAPLPFAIAAGIAVYGPFKRAVRVAMRWIEEHLASAQPDQA